MKYKLMNGSAKPPERAYNSSAYDLFTLTNILIQPQEICKVKTGIAFEIPFECVGIIKDRSSHGSKGLNVVAGVIDCDYRGEIIVCIKNNTNKAIHFEEHTKIAQMVVLPCVMEELIEVDQLDKTTRGSKGFGSSDVSS